MEYNAKGRAGGVAGIDRCNTEPGPGEKVRIMNANFRRHVPDIE